MLPGTAASALAGNVFCGTEIVVSGVAGVADVVSGAARVAVVVCGLAEAEVVAESTVGGGQVPKRSHDSCAHSTEFLSVWQIPVFLWGAAWITTVNNERKAQMLRITRILRKKIQSPDELSVVPKYGFFDLLHGSSGGSEEFDHFITVFITGSEDSIDPYFPSQIQLD